MRKIIEYIVFFGHSLEDFQNKVNTNLKKDYELYGNTFACGDYLIQPMVKYSNECEHIWEAITTHLVVEHKRCVKCGIQIPN